MTIVRDLILLSILCFCLSAPAAGAVCKEPNQRLLEILMIDTSGGALSPKQQAAVADCLIVGTKAYLQEVNAIGSWSFKGRHDISAENAIALASEAKQIALSLAEMLLHLDLAKENTDVSSVVAWTMIVRQVSTEIAEMSDLKNYGLVESHWNITLRLVLPKLYDRVITPKLLLLVRRKQ